MRAGDSSSSLSWAVQLSHHGVPSSSEVGSTHGLLSSSEGGSLWSDGWWCVRLWFCCRAMTFGGGGLVGVCTVGA